MCEIELITGVHVASALVSANKGNVSKNNNKQAKIRNLRTACDKNNQNTGSHH